MSAVSEPSVESRSVTKRNTEKSYGAVTKHREKESMSAIYEHGRKSLSVKSE